MASTVQDPARHARKKPAAGLSLSHVAMTVVLVSFVLALLAGSLLRMRRARPLCLHQAAYRRYDCVTAHTLRTIPPEVTSTVLALHVSTPGARAASSGGMMVAAGMTSRGAALEHQLGALSRANLSRFAHLQQLTLVRCGVTALAADTFSHQPRLRLLDLSANRIEALPAGVFASMRHMERLVLSQNPLVSLPYALFTDSVIATLILDDSHFLSDLAPGVFEGAAVTELTCNRCALSTLSRDALAPLNASLRVLTLCGNRRSLQVPTHALQALRLKSLDLSGTKLTHLSFISHLQATILNLSGNSELFAGAAESREFASNPFVESLSVARSNLSNVDGSLLARFPAIRALDLSHNQLTTLNMSELVGLGALRRVDASHNAIRELEGYTVANVSGEQAASASGEQAVSPSGCEVLELHDNALQTLPAGARHFLSRLSRLSLGNNPLHCNCELAWLHEWLSEDSEKAGVVDTSAVDTGAGSGRVISDPEMMQCATPFARNFTQVSLSELCCEGATIVNTTLSQSRDVLLCVARGDPPPTVTWTDPHGNTTNLPPDPWSRGAHTYTHDVTISYPGNYTCMAENSAGSETVKVHLSAHLVGLGQVRDPHATIKILETRQGFAVTCLLLALLGYLLRTT